MVNMTRSAAEKFAKRYIETVRATGREPDKKSFVGDYTRTNPGKEEEAELIWYYIYIMK